MRSLSCSKRGITRLTQTDRHTHTKYNRARTKIRANDSKKQLHMYKDFFFQNIKTQVQTYTIHTAYRARGSMALVMSLGKLSSSVDNMTRAASRSALLPSSASGMSSFAPFFAFAPF